MSVTSVLIAVDWFLFETEECSSVSNARQYPVSAAVSTWSDDIVSLAEIFMHLTHTISHFWC